MNDAEQAVGWDERQRSPTIIGMDPLWPWVDETSASEGCRSISRFCFRRLPAAPKRRNWALSGQEMSPKADPADQTRRLFRGGAWILNSTIRGYCNSDVHLAESSGTEQVKVDRHESSPRYRFQRLVGLRGEYGRPGRTFRSPHTAPASLQGVREPWRVPQMFNTVRLLPSASSAGKTGRVSARSGYETGYGCGCPRLLTV